MSCRDGGNIKDQGGNNSLSERDSEELTEATSLERMGRLYYYVGGLLPLKTAD